MFKNKLVCNKKNIIEFIIIKNKKKNKKLFIF